MVSGGFNQEILSLLSKRDKTYSELLHWAAFWGYERVVQRLLDKVADGGEGGVEEKNENDGAATLWEGGGKEEEAVVKELLGEEGDVECKNRYHGPTPLWQAAKKGHEAVVKLLLEKGADIESRDR